MEKIDLIFPAHNRLEFTRESWDALVDNTDWELVDRLSVYSVASADGVQDFLKIAAANFKKAPVSFASIPLTQIVELQTDHIAKSKSYYVGKIDNDTMVSPGWLRASLGVMERNPDLSFLGIEAMNPVKAVPDGEYTYSAADFISGLFVARRSAFEGSRPQIYGKYYGWEEWQQEKVPHLKRGWIQPALPIFLLDRIPYEPWMGLSKMYEKNGWQRATYKYLPECTIWDWKWPGGNSGKVYRKIPDINCKACGGRGRVPVPNLGGVFAFRPCPKCIGIQPA